MPDIKLLTYSKPLSPKIVKSVGCLTAKENFIIEIVRTCRVGEVVEYDQGERL